MLPILPVPMVPQHVPIYTNYLAIQAPNPQNTDLLPPETPVIVPDVPFFSQFKDITAAKWKKVGCGITSLAMIIDYYNPDSVTVNKLLAQGIASGAYLTNAGWIHSGLIALSNKYGLDGSSYDLSKSDSKTALSKLKDFLKDGPVMASIHYKFDPKNPIPHLVVIDAIDDEVVYYNDPASTTGAKQISTTQFLKAWKKKLIVVRPAEESSGDAVS
jgi:ABC-type bacteriocin/lantibiotic exporter with double-glycine peptidase domain